MADFCNQCAAELGLPHGDFKTDREQTPTGYGYRELCEGCGMTMVNEKGDCIYPTCLKGHGLKNV